MTSQWILTAGIGLSSAFALLVLVLLLRNSQARKECKESLAIVIMLMFLIALPAALSAFIAYPMIRVTEQSLVQQAPSERQTPKEEKKAEFTLTAEDWQYWTNQAQVQWAEGKNEESLASLTRAVQTVRSILQTAGQGQGPRKVWMHDLSKVLLMRGQRYLENNQPDKAVEDFSEVIRVDDARMEDHFSRRTKGYHARGTAYEALKQWEKAVADYAKAVKDVQEDSQKSRERLRYLAEKCPDQAARKLAEEALRIGE
jgi:tetratricopeptide (TPR) repeat protein